MLRKVIYLVCLLFITLQIQMCIWHKLYCIDLKKKKKLQLINVNVILFIQLISVTQFKYLKITLPMIFFSFSFRQEFDDYRDADDAVYELNGKELLGERSVESLLPCSYKLLVYSEIIKTLKFIMNRLLSMKFVHLFTMWNGAQNVQGFSMRSNAVRLIINNRQFAIRSIFSINNPLEMFT